MKILIALSALVLSGCVATYTPAPDELGYNKPKTDFNLVMGTGLVYKRETSQCGNNCEKYANMQVQRVELPGQQEALEREEQAYRNQSIAKKCDMRIEFASALMQRHVLLALEQGDIAKADRLTVERKKTEYNLLKEQNDCEARLKAEHKASL